ncbi:MAG: glycosyltransferase family 10 [Bdellovibrionota bacterium]
MKFLIDPPSPVYDNNQFFNLNDPFLNRDNGLSPYVNLKNELEKQGFEVSTFDKSLSDPASAENAYYLSFARIRDIELLKKMKVRPYGFIIMEPPIVQAQPYNLLPELTAFFENVFIHNTEGDGYSLKNVRSEKLRKFFWPQPYTHVLEPHWSGKKRTNAVIMINTKHRQRSFSKRELYSERVKWCLTLNKYIPVKIFGRGWDKFLAINSLSISYVLNYFNIQKIYAGACSSKYEVMSKFDYALCFENFIMNGYITEKIFDCFYAGIIPIYWGGDNISNWIPENTYIDKRKFKNSADLSKYLLTLSVEEKTKYRQNGKAFIESQAAVIYYDLFKSLNLKNLF